MNLWIVERRFPQDTDWYPERHRAFLTRREARVAARKEALSEFGLRLFRAAKYARVGPRK